MYINTYVMHSINIFIAIFNHVIRIIFVYKRRVRALVAAFINSSVADRYFCMSNMLLANLIASQAPSFWSPRVLVGIVDRANFISFVTVGHNTESENSLTFSNQPAGRISTNRIECKKTSIIYHAMEYGLDWWSLAVWFYYRVVYSATNCRWITMNAIVKCKYS